MLMHVKQLEYLIEISKHRSMNKASELLFISPQALSLSMKSLEESVGAQLLVRTPQGILLTEEGKKLVEIAERFLKELKELKKGHDTSAIFGEIDLFTPEPLLENFLAKPLGRIYKECPNLTIQVRSFAYEDTLKNVCARKLPYCFWYQCYIDDQNIMNDIPLDFSFVGIMKVKFCCCVSKAHPFVKHKSVSLVELCNQSVIIHTPSQYVLNKILYYKNISPKRIEVQNTVLMNEFVKSNAGVAFSSFSLNKFKTCIPYDNSLVHVPFKENIIGEIGYLVPNGQTLSFKTRAFLEMMARELNEI